MTNELIIAPFLKWYLNSVKCSLQGPYLLAIFVVDKPSVTLQVVIVHLGGTCTAFIQLAQPSRELIVRWDATWKRGTDVGTRNLTRSCHGLQTTSRKLMIFTAHNVKTSRGFEAQSTLQNATQQCRSYRQPHATSPRFFSSCHSKFVRISLSSADLHYTTTGSNWS